MGKVFMKKQTDTFKRLRAVMKDINGDNRQIIRTMQDQIEYLVVSGILRTFLFD